MRCCSASEPSSARAVQRPSRPMEVAHEPPRPISTGAAML